jgi:ABC-type phosphonate transport system ATPase subunit
MDLNKLSEVSFEAVPNEVKPLVAGLLSGQIKSLAVVFETIDGDVGDAWFLDIDDNSNRYTLLGAIESLKRDYMRCEIESRLEYFPAFTVDEEDDDD